MAAVARPGRSGPSQLMVAAVVARLDPHQADLMLRTAIVGTLDAEVCSAVLGRRVTTDDLRGLEVADAVLHGGREVWVEREAGRFLIRVSALG